MKTTAVILSCALLGAFVGLAIPGCKRHHDHTTFVDAPLPPNEDPETGDSPDPEFGVSVGDVTFHYVEVWIGDAGDIFGDELIGQMPDGADILIFGSLQIPILAVEPGEYEVTQHKTVRTPFTTTGRITLVPLRYLQALGLLANVLTIDGVVASAHGKLKVKDDYIKVGDLKIRPVGADDLDDDDDDDGEDD